MSEGGLVAAICGILFVAVLLTRLGTLERRLDRLSRLEAKVDALLTHTGATFDPFQDVPAGVQQALDQGERILAIKRFREATGVGLKEAKEYVDELRRRRAAIS